MKKVEEKQGIYIRSGRPGKDQETGPTLATGFGARISAAADKIGTRQAAADAAGVSQDSLQRYIREDVEPPFRAIVNLARRAGVRLDWLAFNEGPMQHARAPLAGPQRELLRRFNNYRIAIASGMPQTSAMLQYVDDYNTKLATVSPVDGIDRVTIEELADWLNREADEPRLPAVSPQEINVLGDVVQVVEEFLQERGLLLDPKKKAELIVLIYEDVRGHQGKVDRARVIRLVNLAA